MSAMKWAAVIALLFFIVLVLWLVGLMQSPTAPADETQDARNCAPVGRSVRDAERCYRSRVEDLPPIPPPPPDICKGC
jgi:hypothetical protein